MTAISTPAIPAQAVHRGWITMSVMLPTIMQALDTTIANVALPHMQGTMGATLEQISWVLTSYIVAAAIFMPVTGFLSARLGRKRVFMWSVVGFTVASMLCGAAQSLGQIVMFRILQGVFSAALVPLSQAVLLDTYPRERHGSAMAMWGVGVMIGPILGPSLGGWLTEYYNWRWVFYINLPVGILAWFGLATFVHETPTSRTRQFDVLGFSFLALSIGAMQMMLDRGESLDWFASREVVIEAMVAGLCLYLFLVHIFTHERPFIDPAIFKDRNFSVGLIFFFVVGLILLATMALMPPFMQSIMGYPVVDVGFLLVPRGVGTMITMFIVGRVANKIDMRYSILLGLALTSLSLWEMTHFTAGISSWDIVRTGVTQGMGLGCTFVPLTTITFSTLAPHYRNEGTSLFSLMRSLGNSTGVSIVIANLSRRTQINRGVFADYVNPLSIAWQQATEAGIYDLASPEGLAIVERMVTREAATLAFLQDFRLMMWITLAAIPLILLFRKPARHAPPLANPSPVLGQGASAISGPRQNP